MKEYISVRGANVHNLKHLNVDIPRNQLVVITGLSGSGKSSLAFDTIYAEGQRRYVESLSAYARQFLGQMDKPDVELIEGLSPAISIDQKTTSRNPRSTVGTVTEINDYLRLLYARIGKAYCPVCGDRILGQSVDQIVDSILKLGEGSRLQILAPLVRGRKGQHEKVFERILRDGFVRARVDGTIYNIADEMPVIEKNNKHNIDVLIDRIILKENVQSRLADAIELALNISNGIVEVLCGEENYTYSSKFACIKHDFSIPELEPRSFSFNSPYGACPSCNGLGYREVLDPRKLIDYDKSLDQNALNFIYNSMENSSYYRHITEHLVKKYDIDTSKPFGTLDKKFIDTICYGTGGKELEYSFISTSGKLHNRKHSFDGLITNIERRYQESQSEFFRKRLSHLFKTEVCTGCHGKRLKKESLCVRVGEKNIAEFLMLPITEALEYVDSLELEATDRRIATQIIKEIADRLSFLNDVGLSYLTLDRMANTLSGGEAQRIRLATQIGSSLMGVLYILDEPSIGLHQKDNERLLGTLRRLTDMGNTVLVVEHDEDTMYAADHIIDIGPRAGIYGGELVAQGSIDDIKANKNSITGAYLRGDIKILPNEVPRAGNKKNLSITKASANNLKDINVKFPLGKLICVTGVSGSGKSSLVNEVLAKSMHNILNENLGCENCKTLRGYENITNVVNIDQSPIGRTPRSNPATYTGLFTYIRELFASLKESKLRGYEKGRFSFNVSGGRCEACKGDGILKIEMHFLSDVYVPCQVCKGKRYNRETLQVKYKGKNIYDVLDMQVQEAIEFFETIPSIHKILSTLMEVGLDYIKLGQPATSLSGGEAQRVKLASELIKRSTGNTLYILDEPTTGLHFADVHKLINILNRLVDAGNTVVVIEHNLDVIKCADHIIDLGPDGGKGGGQIVATGTPLEVSKNEASYTGKFLRKLL